MAETIKSIESNVEPKDYWYAHFQNYQKSGLNKIGYVREYKLSEHRFMYWIRKFELASCAPNPDTRNGFVAIKMESEPSRRLNPVLCSLWLGNYQLLIHDIAALPPIMQLLK